MSKARAGSREELPNVRGQGQQPRVPGCNGTGMAERSYPASEVRGGSQEEPTHAQGQGRQPGGATPGAVAVWAQEGLEKLSHVEGQEGQGQNCWGKYQ